MQKKATEFCHRLLVPLNEAQKSYFNRLFKPHHGMQSALFKQIVDQLMLLAETHGDVALLTAIVQERIRIRIDKDAPLQFTPVPNDYELSGCTRTSVEAPVG